ncbi:4,5-dioxygenase [Photobacterium sp. SDRW27]|uniref:DOPA 4,5-dioxygenase family protein n=1 Tax=Photobacterium obscurum TaxID=2829490 RepID=UPI00224478CB|nr:DOPA 4,5-dioxygenase family protein [Photobacterium obscurum]MCW8328688.1 4,5-dioxygenase [Photobacterium obscurum]
MYHAHIYFDLTQQPIAEQIYQQIKLSRIDVTSIFPLVNRRVGPHDKPMFEVHFNDNQYGFIEWLDQHRAGLSVLIHPVTSNALADHTSGAYWLGEELAVHTEIFENCETD